MVAAAGAVAAAAAGAAAGGAAVGAGAGSACAGWSVSTVGTGAAALVAGAPRQMYSAPAATPAIAAIPNSATTSPERLRGAVMRIDDIDEPGARPS